MRGLVAGRCEIESLDGDELRKVGGTLNCPVC